MDSLSQVKMPGGRWNSRDQSLAAQQPSALRTLCLQFETKTDLGERNFDAAVLVPSLVQSFSLAEIDSADRAGFGDSDDDDVPDMEESGSNQNSPSKKNTSSKKFSDKSSSDDSSEDEGIEKKSVHNDESSSSNVSDSEGILGTFLKYLLN